MIIFGELIKSISSCESRELNSKNENNDNSIKKDFSFKFNNFFRTKF